MTENTRLVLFDCDGTLVDSQHLIYECIRLSCAQFSLATPELATARRVVGLQLSEALATLLPGLESDKYVEITEFYKQTY